MSKPVLRALPELIEAGIISEENAEKIKQYYLSRPDKSGARALLVFGILGAILIGLGIILIIAHNWDQLPKFIKIIIAFLPMILGQLACGWALYKKTEQRVWKEASAAFLFLAIGACISMVSQIYNIPGKISDLMFLWMLLGLPLVYLLSSSIASFIYISGITYYACLIGYSEYPSHIPYFYWLFLALVLPHYYWLIKNKPTSNFTVFHHWLLPLSLIITLGTFGQQEEMLMFLAYFSLFGWLYLVGRLTYFEEQAIKNNGFLVLGSLGSVILLLILSFDFFWDELYYQRSYISDWWDAPEIYLSIVLTLLASIFLFLLIKKSNIQTINLLDILYLIFLAIFLSGLYAPVQSLIFVNILIFVLGLLYINRGMQKDHLGILNYGLLIITALIICRFFDTKWSFIIRGALFVIVGIGFFIANYRILKRRKSAT